MSAEEIKEVSCRCLNDEYNSLFMALDCNYLKEICLDSYLTTLVISENEEIRSDLSQLLNNLGMHSVTLASTLPEAITILLKKINRTGCFHLIFLDDSGRKEISELVEMIMSDPSLSEGKIVLVNSSPHPKRAMELMRLGAVAHIQPPIKEEKLVQVIESIFHIHRNAS